MVLQTWLIEIAKGIGKIFLNPLLYWIIILYFVTSYRRIKRERKQFGMKVYDMFSEGRHTILIAIVFSIIISVLSVSFGIVLSLEIMIVLALVMFLLSVTGSVMLLSASYTIGIAFLLLLLLPFAPLKAVGAYVDFTAISPIHFIGLAMLAGLFLLAEGMLIGSTRNRLSYPALSLSNRGVRIGEHHLKKMAFIPFFAFLPTGNLGAIAPLFPYFEYGNQSFSFILFPFVIGYHYRVRGDLPGEAARKLGQETLYISSVVLLCAAGSLFFPVLSFVAILLAIVGKEWMTYRFRMKDRKQPAYFTPLDKGVRVLATIPDSPADRLGIMIGETITKVNGTVVANSAEFYEALQNSGAFFKLDVLDHQGEVRFVNSAFYEEDHYKLGIVFPEDSAHRLEESNGIGEEEVAGS